MHTKDISYSLSLSLHITSKCDYAIVHAHNKIILVSMSKVTGLSFAPSLSKINRESERERERERETHTHTSTLRKI